LTSTRESPDKDQDNYDSERDDINIFQGFKPFICLFFARDVYIWAAQWQALAVKAGIGGKNLKGENALGTESLKAETYPAFCPPARDVGCF